MTGALPDRHQVENNLKLLGPLGIDGVTPVFDVRLSAQGEAETISFLQSKQYRHR